MGETVQTENPLGYENIGKLIRSFAIPSIIAMLVSSLYNVVDQIFIGQGVGYLGNAATNVAFPFTTICMAITLTIGIGSAARFSLYLGQKEETEAAKVVGAGFCMMLLFGVCYVAIGEFFMRPLLWIYGATKEVFPYVLSYSRITMLGMPFLVIMNGLSNLARADGSPMYSMTTMIIGAVLNIVLDPVFIFGFQWGVAGAAWATVIGQLVSCLFAGRYLWHFKRITLKKEYFRFSFSQAGKTIVMGMSNGLTQIAITVVQIVMNRSLIHYGALSIYGTDIPLAASGVVMKVNSIVFAVFIGLNQGMQPIVGFNYGAKFYSRVKKTYFNVIKVILAISLAALFVFQVFPDRVLLIFGKENKLYMEFAVMFMRTFLLFLPLGGVQMLSSNFFAAIGKPVRGAVLSLTRQVFFLIPLMLILPLFFGIKGVLYAAPGADLLAFLVVFFFILMEMRAMTQTESERNIDEKDTES